MTGKRFLWPALLAALLGVYDCLPLRASEPGPSPKHVDANGTRHNIVFILTDDLEMGGIQAMPQLKKLLVDQGTSLSNFFVTVSLCCPSRSSILRGQYVHNHGITQNTRGFQKFRDLGHESSTVAIWLKAAGYTTALMGKYLNGYPGKGGETYVPPGWDEWHSPIDNRKAYGGFGYRMNENGKIVTYGDAPKDYLTDVLARKAKVFIKRAAAKGTPFFLYLAPYTPHNPATPAPRHQNLFPSARAPQISSFNEKNLSTKPAFVRTLPSLTEEDIDGIDQLYRKRLQSLQAVDDLLADMIAALKETGLLQKTYIVFTSDNGFHLGQHRLMPGKQTAYEEDIRVPLVIRGPGMPAGHVVSHLALETDLAPTFAEWAGAAPPSFVDGRSLAPLLRSNPPRLAEWRQGVLIEHMQESKPFLTGLKKRTLGDKLHVPAYTAMRSMNYLYVEYETGERELYDLRKDPAELTNTYASAPADLRARLSSWIARVRNCSGLNCRSAEETPLAEGILHRAG
ncbi:MAG: sulfatase [Deltaproteobacteria bacterium]|nr:sulfatase [Deltaproteobacteria bacterium]